MQKTHEKLIYDDDVIKLFINAALLWGAVAMLLGVTAAFQLADWHLNFNLEWFSFGRIRPIHTNGAIFGFAGNGIFAGIYHSSQRLLKTKLFSRPLAWFHFIGWQLIIVAAAISLAAGYSHGKEYAELEWPIDLAITLVWVAFAVNFFGMLAKRREKHIYVALWFYIATIITVAVLHIVNSIEIPVSLMKSYPIYAGAQDALVQWWYGHNAVAFFLTTPFLGLMYYYVPKAINRPVYSYKLSIIHFWSLVFIYIWAGPHHLLYTSLPEWAQTLGMIFSIMLWAPSWGGMINGLLTMRGAWNRVFNEPILKFMVAAITFYGMATFEGPLLSIKSINHIAHFTDWIVGHVHSGTIGWNYFLLAAMFLYLIPKLYKTTLYSERLANWQFWLGTIGLLLYMMSMWAAGITQGLMWRAVDESGRLVYPYFIETVVRIIPMYWIRGFGGVFVFISFILMIYNIVKTISLAPKSEPEEFLVPVMDENHGPETGHRKLEGLTLIFTVLTALSILVGSAIEILPTFLADKFVVKNDAVKPYSALEIAGRDIYIREGCYTCHSQQIRPTVAEKLRYGEPSTAAESIYDRPFQWGSRRIGPDLARVGGKYPDMWHYRHMLNPREVTQKSIMPNYPWLFEKNTEFGILTKKLKVMKSLGVPYSDTEVENAVLDAKKQAESITNAMISSGVSIKMKDKQIIALIAYLQRLGKDTKTQAEVTAQVSP
jgi:cytochrome c oxidase cbb3-type subunit I/II